MNTEELNTLIARLEESLVQLKRLRKDMKKEKACAGSPDTMGNRLHTFKTSVFMKVSKVFHSNNKEKNNE